MMARQSDEVNQPKKMEPRESDNPIVEDFKEELLRRPSYGARSIGARSIMTSDAERLERLEGLIVELRKKIKLLEQRIEVLEEKGEI
jgi:hypothetical protein